MDVPPLLKLLQLAKLNAAGFTDIDLEVTREYRTEQARERRLPGLLKNRPTQLFNGYADQVASLYAGMDKKVLFY